MNFTQAHVSEDTFEAVPTFHNFVGVMLLKKN